MDGSAMAATMEEEAHVSCLEKAKFSQLSDRSVR
jgi:hypothetical protein